MLADGVQTATANVMVQYVQSRASAPGSRPLEGGQEVQAVPDPVASGTLEVFRGGTEFSGTWRGPSLGSAHAGFRTATGTHDPRCGLVRPGSTWFPCHHGPPVIDRQRPVGPSGGGSKRSGQITRGSWRGQSGAASTP